MSMRSSFLCKYVYLGLMPALAEGPAFRIATVFTKTIRGPYRCIAGYLRLLDPHVIIIRYPVDQFFAWLLAQYTVLWTELLHIQQQ